VFQVKYISLSLRDGYYDAYKIITLNSEVFEYESFSSGNRYTLIKVPDDFVFPDDKT